MSGRIEIYNKQKEETSKWSRNSSFDVKEAGVDIEKDPQGGGGTGDYDDLTDKPSINGVTLSGDKSSADLGLSEAEPLTNAQLYSLLEKLS